MKRFVCVCDEVPTSMASAKMKKAMKRRNRAFTNPAITSALTYLCHTSERMG